MFNRSVDRVRYLLHMDSAFAGLQHIDHAAWGVTIKVERAGELLQRHSTHLSYETSHSVCSTISVASHNIFVLVQCCMDGPKSNSMFQLYPDGLSYSQS